MNNIINFYYGINVIGIYELDDKFIFKYNNDNYYFIKFDRDKRDLKGLIEVFSELKRRNIATNEIINNRTNNYLTPYNKKYYILIKENVIEHKINVNDILYMQNNTYDISFNKNLIRNNWVELWKNKVDYYEKINIKNKLIINSFDYYIGLSENAISYLVNNEIKVNHVVLSHRRISSNRDSFDFYNPLNYILDNRARDIADFIKILFFYENTNPETILSLLYYLNFSREEYILLYARLLYPTYYFDLIDKIIYNYEDENILKSIINKTSSYVSLLKRIIYYINYELRMNIPVIEWIIKK